MFYISSDSLALAGSSPETLVKLVNGVLHTFPLAGTRPRGKTEEEDLTLESSLCPIPRNLRNTTCSSIWDETTWDACPVSGPYR